MQGGVGQVLMLSRYNDACTAALQLQRSSSSPVAQLPARGIATVAHPAAQNVLRRHLPINQISRLSVAPHLQETLKVSCPE